MTEPSIRNPIILSKMRVHQPGFGIKETSLGKSETARYGRAIPVPMEMNTAYTVAALCVRDQAVTAPRRGPLQGVASNAARKPLTKESEARDLNV